ncbi:MAG: transposase, partial [Polyangiales bacterium]
PQFAAAGNRAAATEAVERLRAFKTQYARALARWMAGDRDACFPLGTWWMRVCHGARCGPGP